jgi:hypothetical protein
MRGKLPGFAHLATLFAFLALASGCSSTSQQAASAPQPPAPASQPSIAAPPHAVARTFKTVPDSDWVTAERESDMDPAVPAFNPLLASGSADQIKAHFRGKDRREAKISVAQGNVETFASLDAMAQSLPTDDAMLKHDPPIATSTSDRMQEEGRNVEVPLWIYAIKYESDQDWHIIAGTDPAQDQKTYFNCEVSGLPAKDAADYDTLLNVRNDLDTILDHQLPGPGSYHTYYDDPIPVTIDGSVFYDVDHKPGVVGPSDRKPATSWEIHPITDLKPRT